MTNAEIKPVAYLEVEPSAKRNTLKEVLQFIIFYSSRWHFLCEKPEVSNNALFPIYSQETVSALQKENEELRGQVTVLRDALCRIAQPAHYDCGCSFPCRCDTPEEEAINAEEMRENAKEALQSTAPKDE